MKFQSRAMHTLVCTALACAIPAYAQAEGDHHRGDNKFRIEVLSSKPYLGSLGAHPPANPIVGIAAT